MLSTTCTVNRSIPTNGRSGSVRRLPICLFCLVLLPSFLYAGPHTIEEKPTGALLNTAPVFYLPTPSEPDTSAPANPVAESVFRSAGSAEDAGPTDAGPASSARATDTGGLKDHVGDQYTPTTGVRAAEAGTPSEAGADASTAAADSSPEPYAEERNGDAGFALLTPFLEGSDRAAAPAPPWPDFGRFDVPISYNERVKEAIHILRNDAFDVFAAWLGRTNNYRAMIQSILSKSGLPGDLIYVAMVESGFDPRARSAEGGAGLWQLSPEDAERYGLTRSGEIDERYDPEKSTRAAASRFKDLYLELGSWELVLAAHHAGSTPLRTAEGLSLWNMRLPRQTIPFVSFVMAAAIISQSPEEYGFEPVGGLPMIHESVPVPRPMALEEVAGGMRVPVEQLRRLNPELRRWKAESGYNLKVPLGTTRSYAAWAGIEPPGPDPSDLTFYRVRRGDTLGRIARRFGVRTADIVVENNIRRPNRLRIGQVLTIPLYGSPNRLANRSIHNRKPRDVQPPDPSTHRAVSYRIRRGDTLASISRRYGVSMANLQDWNKLNNPGDIIAGRTLTIYVPRTSQGASTSGTSTPNRESAARDATTRGEGGAAASDAITYTVRPGDTLWDIARAHNVTVSALRRTNGLSRRNAIHPGDRLRIDRPDSR